MLSAAATYAPKSIRVNCVAPGLTRTPLAARITSNPAVRWLCAGSTNGAGGGRASSVVLFHAAQLSHTHTPHVRSSMHAHSPTQHQTNPNPNLNPNPTSKPNTQHAGAEGV